MCDLWEWRRSHAEIGSGLVSEDRNPLAAVKADSGGDISEPGLLRRFLSWRTLVSFVVAGALLAVTWVLADLRPDEIAAKIRAADLRLIAVAYFVYALTFPVRTFRWRVLLNNAARREHGDPHYRLRDLFQILYISWFVNGVVPAKLGDIYRAYMARANYGTSLTRTLGTIFSERVFDVGTLIGMVLVSAALIVRAPETSEDVGRILTIAAVGLTVLALSVAFLLLFGTPIFARLPQRAAGVYERFHSGIFDSWTWRTGPFLWVASILIWSLEILRLAMVMRALGLIREPEETVFVGVAGYLLLAVPTPGGLGAVEGGLLGLMRLIGVAAALAGTVVILDRMISYWSVMLTGGLLFVMTRLKRQ